MSIHPLMHMAASPRPNEGMSKEPIVFGPTPFQMLDELLSAGPRATAEVASRERPQQQFRLVQPRSMDGGEQEAHLGVVGTQQSLGVASRVARSTVPDQVDPTSTTVLVKQLRQDLAQMGAIIAVQAPAAHVARVDHQSDQQIQRAVADVFKLLAFNLPRSHRGGGTASLQDLEMRLLIHTDHHLPLLGQGCRSLIAPQHLSGPLAELGIERRRLPIAEAMGLQVRPLQDQRDGRVGKMRKNTPRNGHACQSPRRPMGDLQTNPARLATGQLFDFHALQGGKSPTAVLTGEHQRRPRPLPSHTADTRARWYCARGPVVPPSPARWCQGRSSLTKCAPGALPAAPCVHLAPRLPGIDNPPSLTRSDAVAVSSYGSPQFLACLEKTIYSTTSMFKNFANTPLEATSVAGMECSAAAIAAGLGERTAEVEERCTAFARRGHFVQANGIEEWPDGTVAARYRFVHALYQEVFYERVTAARQVSLHQRIGERVERGYGQQAGE